MKWRMIRLWLAIFALLILSGLGFWGLINEWHSADTIGQQFSAGMQSIYSLLGLVAAGALLMKQRWSRGALYAWAATMTFTGLTAPVVWGEGGWSAGLSAAAITALMAGAVIWLAPLSPPGAAFKRWRWLMAGVFCVAALVVLSATVRKVAPLVVEGEHMERFCESVRSGITEKELADLVGREGYLAHPGDDAKGHYLRIEDDAAKGRYRCEARFNPDGTIAVINFTADRK